MEIQLVPDHVVVKDMLHLPVGDERSKQWNLNQKQIQHLLDIATDAVEIVASFSRLDQGLLCEMTTDCVIRLECSRCLKQFDYKSSGTNRFEYVERTNDVADEEERPIRTDGSIDIEQQIIDCVIPSIPLNPLHAKNCHGLCQVCGVNLNEQPKHFSEHSDHEVNSSLGNTIHFT